MNHTHVTQAEDHLAAVATARDHLQALYAEGRKPTANRDRLGQQIAETHQAIGHGMKAAEIHALLGIAQALAGGEPLRVAVEDPHRYTYPSQAVTL